MTTPSPAGPANVHVPNTAAIPAIPAVSAVPALLDRLCDDAAVFPPGSLPLAEAVPAHLAHLAGAHRALVGPFVLAAASLPDLAPLVTGLPEGRFEVALTVAKPGAVSVALALAEFLPALAVAALEVAVPPDVPASAVVPVLDAALAGRAGIDVFVELPRDGRRGELIAALGGTAYLAKLRTGGVRADLYPDDAELGAAVVELARAGLPFKATAGLHHAVRNTDPATGFEQHGFLNLIAAVAAAQAGADTALVAQVLAERDPVAVAERVRGLCEIGGAAARRQFRSFGTCSIDEPVAELTALDLIAIPQGAPA